jgi:hypothetical protein
MMAAVKQYMPQDEAAVLEKNCLELEQEFLEDSRIIRVLGAKNCATTDLLQT